MNEQEQRFHAAVAAMQGLCSNSSPGIPSSEYAKSAISFANALLAELDRTAPKPQPDADGWIAHDGGPQPCPDDMRIVRKYRDGSIYDDEMTADKFYWFHDGEDFDIVAWKPADK